MKLFRRGEVSEVWDALKVDVFTTRLFVDPVAVPLVVLCSKIKWITPNMVSLFALLAGTIAALMFYKGHFIFGAILYYTFFLFDCIDGKLARLTSKFDKLGGFYDFAIDRFVVSAMTFGMTVALIRQDLFTSAIFLILYIIVFLLKDVLELKWKESIIDDVVCNRPAVSIDGLSGVCNRCKVHFKPGQILSCFVVFIIGPLSGKYHICFVLGSVFVLFSIAANIVAPYVKYLRGRQ